MGFFVTFIIMIGVEVAVELIFPRKPTTLTLKEAMALNCLRQAIGDPPFHTVEAANEFVNALDFDRKLKVLRAIHLQLTN